MTGLNKENRRRPKRIALSPKQYRISRANCCLGLYARPNSANNILQKQTWPYDGLTTRLMHATINKAHEVEQSSYPPLPQSGNPHWDSFCGRGGIGRRAGFRFRCRKAYEFKSLRPHQKTYLPSKGRYAFFYALNCGTL